MAVSVNVRRLFLSFILLAVCQTGKSDTLLLKQGGRVQGQVSVKRDDRDRINSYIVRLDSGFYLKLAPNQVKRHVKVSKKLATYQRLLKSMPDTAASHWEVAEYCRKNGIVDRKKFHIEHALSLDPNHQAARKALGYIWRDGAWTRQEDEMTNRGYVLHNGTWRLQQDIEIQSRNSTIEDRRVKLRAEMKNWRGWIGGRQESQAVQNFKSLRDPLAVLGLKYLLKKENDEKMREIYVDVLGRLQSLEATTTLIDIALFDVDAELRARAIELLSNRPDRQFASQSVLQYLSPKNGNRTVNRAGHLLGKLGHRDAILPLIDVLVTTHTKTYAPKGNIRPIFSNGPNGGGAGLSMNQKPKTIRKDYQNGSVLNALVSITNQNFRYSKQEWRDWYKQQQAPTSFNLRRDL